MPTVNFNTQLPGYDVLSELGRGNTRVLKARHVATGDIVAIKQFAYAVDADTLRRFEQESVIMTGIVHPNIVRLREVQLNAPMPYIVMDFIEGGDLRSLLRRDGQLDVQTTIRLGLQVSAAFRAIHPAGIVHRDVKPENVLYRQLISHELHFLLTDFGIAKVEDNATNRTRTGQSLMTYEYAAPEQFDNPRQVNKAADYYALGVMLYECLTGRVPFPLQNEMGLAQFMQQVLTASLPEPMLPTGQPLPPSLRVLLTNLLVRNPQDRLRDPDELELLLEQGRVEWLKASRSASTAPTSSTRTVAGPVITAPVSTEGYDDPAEELPQRSSLTGWIIGAAVLAVLLAVLVFGFLRPQTRKSASKPAVQSNAAVDSTKESGVVAGDSINQDPPESGESEIPPTSDLDKEELSKDPSDSVINMNGPPVPDSVRATPPDSTPKTPDNG